VKLTYLLLIILFLSSFSKPLVKTGNNICKKNKDEFSLEKALQTIREGMVKDSAELACIHHQVALRYYINYDYLLSLKHNKEALKIREQINDGFLWKTHHNIALIYDELEEYKKAIQHNQKAYSLPGAKTPKDSISILRFLSMEYAEIGDIEEALQYGNIATKVEASDVKIAQAFHSLGSILAQTNDSIYLKLALQHLNKALSLIKNNQNFDLLAIPYYGNIGVAYHNLNEEEQALKNYYKALDLVASQDSLYRSSILNNIGYVLITQKKYDLALEKINEALRLKQTYFKKDTHHFRYAFNYENIADCNVKMKKYKTALHNYQTAINNLTNSFRSADIFQNPVLTDNLYVYSNLGLIRVLDAKAKTAFALYQKNKDESYLQLAHQTYQTLLDFHNKLQQEISTENSRLFQAKNLLPYLENALKVVYALQNNESSTAESAFRLMEKNKATVLLQSINESQALQYANLPNAIVEQEGELKTAISFYKKQLNDAKVLEKIDEIARIEKLLFEEENKYNRLITDLESNFPNYYQLKYQQNEIRLIDVQNYLNKHTALLEYFVGDHSIYVLLIHKDNSKLYQFPKPKNWNDLINNLRRSLIHIDAIQQKEQTAYDVFTQGAHSLYNILLKPVLDELNPAIKHLQIIPDAALNYVPFDVLLTELPDRDAINYADLAYLIKNQTISYAYSATLLLESNVTNYKEKALGVYAGFAPVYRSKNDNPSPPVVLRNNPYVDLPNARTSVEQITKLISGDDFLANEATKQQFINKASQYKILHLAMHGFLNDENPLYSNLVFTKTSDSADHLLHAADLYNVELNADLVVLSACNTGTGKLQKGEGVMSLSRAFTYAGSNSLVMSLWEVPDKSTSIIMQNFFTTLKKGYPKDKALQAAKLDFVTNHPMRAHPLYWAGFVPSGNMVAIDFEVKRNNWWFWVLIFITVFLGIGLIYLIRTKILNSNV